MQLPNPNRDGTASVKMMELSLLETNSNYLQGIYEEIGSLKEILTSIFNVSLNQVKLDKKEKTADAWKGRRSYVVDFGHGWTSNTELKEGKRSSPACDAYKEALAAKVGKDRMEDILEPEFHNSLLYPNCSIMGLNIHVRIIKPISADLTEVTVYPVKLKGAPDEMNSANIRLLNITHSATSFVQTDDLEAFRRTQLGLQSQQSDWIDFSRGMGEEEADPHYNATRESAMHEMAIRAQYQAWLYYMCEAA